MSQNVYDQQEFFESYIKLDRQVRGLAGAPEWPQLKAMLPNLDALNVLDLGCGFGWFARFARENGAASVRAIDLSERMLNKARSLTNDEKIEYERADLEELRLAENYYDVVFSSLTFHYIANLPTLIKEIGKSLRPSGHLVCSIEHPIYTAPSRPSFVVDEKTGRQFWPLDGYQDEGLRSTNWFVERVKKQHRTVGTYIKMFLNNNLQLADFTEWYPDEKELELHPSWESELERPTFLLIGAIKR
ncbi:methyltransferase type 11 [Hypoxylon rubiginosum]|uniref:Methyltransferase type 11 n=1 Tax=Hypoxylon rubiginosum TaxID=110542 RepID=A0ACC0DF09_9PEZI|nr:methyltransferase type 11 [Hypoxylon rubiginosum]